MTYGPFQTEKAGKIILTLAKDKLLSSVKDLQEFSIKVAAYRPNLYKAFFRNELRQLEDSYEIKNRDFLELYHHYSTPDLLFAEIKPDADMGLYVADYFTSRQAITSSFQEGFHFIEIIG